MSAFRKGDVQKIRESPYKLRFQLNPKAARTRAPKDCFLLRQGSPLRQECYEGQAGGTGRNHKDLEYLMRQPLMNTIQFQISYKLPAQGRTGVWSHSAQIQIRHRNIRQQMSKLFVIGPLLVEFSLNQEALKFHRLIAERNKWSIFPA
jgi:hypothetical protein